MTYDLTRLGSREFEHLVQALAVAVFGPGTGVFGSGKDGGREATFYGPVPIVTNGHQWDGYGVVQAKYKERLDQPSKNAAWLVHEMRTEFAQWDRSPERRTPEYYVLASNVVLSPVLEVGGVDKVGAELAKWVDKWGMRGFDVWHHDKIVALLESHPEVADSYAAWITPSKLLADLKQQLHRRFGNDETFDALARSYPARELIAQRYVNLDQAGRADDQRIRLAQVFVDVPVGREPRIETGAELAGVIQTIVDGCDRKVAPTTSQANTGRIVVVGGPGQGKSTASQFLCQIYRRELLAPESMSPEVGDEAEHIGQQLRKEGIATPVVRRWPVHIPLNRLADELARDMVSGVLDHIARRVTKQTEVEIRPVHCREWLRCYPWLVVLDGLDEVPASGNRHQLMEAVERFLADVHTLGADVFVVATTRPQGYREEFSPRYYRHLELAPLPLETGLRYGEELIRLRTGDDGERIEQLIARLRDAGASNATARLMETPLQVTILTVLISRMGEVPQHRFDLFNDYYGTIFNRELEKGGETARLLRDYRGLINTLHDRVGLLLQKMGEGSGESSSLLPVETLRQLARAELQDEELCGADLTKLTDRIVEAATDRLVFLVAPREDLIGFEIRSLQEYCAARGITDCSDEDVLQRLETLAPSSYWRNVVLFVCGWIFFHRRHLRDSALVICDDLDSAGDDNLGTGPRTLPGARLALALAADVGASIMTPKYQRQFGVRAAQLLRLLPCAAQRDLAELPVRTLRYVAPLAEELLASPDPLTKAGVLRFAAALAEKGDNSLLERAGRSVAADGLAGGEIALRLGFQDLDPHLLNLAKECALTLSLPELSSMRRIPEFGHRRFWRNGRMSDLLNPALRPLLSLSGMPLDRDPLGQRLEVKHRSMNITLSVVTLGECADSPLWTDVLENRASFRGTAWSWLVPVAEFCRNPSEETLGGAVRGIGRNFGEFIQAMQVLPWPIGSALLEYPTPAEAADAAVSGKLGTPDSWRQRERFWSEGEPRQVLRDYPIAVARVGLSLTAPPDCSEGILTTGDLLAIWGSLPPGYGKDMLARTVVFVISSELRRMRIDCDPIEREDVEAVVAAAARVGEVPANWIYGVEDLATWADSIAHIGDTVKLYNIFADFENSADVKRRDIVLLRLAKLWSENPGRAGIGRFMSALLPAAGLAEKWSPALEFPRDDNSPIAAELDMKTRNFSGWDAGIMASLICADGIGGIGRSAFAAVAHPEFPGLDREMLRLLREKAWYLAARLQESMVYTQEATPVDTTEFIPEAI